jgi:hypothetical protein
MKHLALVLFLLYSCKKSTNSIDSYTYDFSKDSCGYNLLKGVYVSTSNVNDTIVIDSCIIRTNNISSCNQIGRIPNYYKYCIGSKYIELKYNGYCKINLPSIQCKYKFENNTLVFDTIVYGDKKDFYSHLISYQYKKIN